MAVAASPPDETKGALATKRYGRRSVSSEGRLESLSVAERYSTAVVMCGKSRPARRDAAGAGKGHPTTI